MQSMNMLQYTTRCLQAMRHSRLKMRPMFRVRYANLLHQSMTILSLHILTSSARMHHSIGTLMIFPPRSQFA